MQHWSPSSWRSRPARQLPVYRDADALEASERRLKSLPSLIFPGEIDQLRARLAAVSRGEAFLWVETGLEEGAVAAQGARRRCFDRSNEHRAARRPGF